MTSHIANCIEHGIPAALVLPICPHDKPLFRRNSKGGELVKDTKGSGKAPARLAPNWGPDAWVNLKHWQHGNLASGDLMQADIDGANAGLLLGKLQDGFKFVAVDIDMISIPFARKNGKKGDRGTDITRKFIRDWLRHTNEATTLVRSTVPHRAMLLIRLPPEADVGSKAVIRLDIDRENGVKDESTFLGKIEILTEGQQCVIAGTHASGSPITWSRIMAGTEEPAPYPNVREGGALLPDFDYVLKAVLDVAKGINAGIAVSVPALASHTFNPVDLAGLKAPSISDLVTLLRRLPNTSGIDRDDWLRVGFASAAALKGVAGDQITPEDVDAVRDAFVAWTMLWPQGEDEQDAIEKKWFEDFYQQGEYELGWDFLVGFGIRMGLSDLATSQAVQEFSAETPPRPPTSQELVTHARAAIPDRENRQGVDSPDSDIQIIDALEKPLKNMAWWVPEENNWIIWDAPAGWRRDPTNESYIRSWVEDQVWEYTYKYQLNWNGITKRSVLSRGRVRAVEGGLRDRRAKANAELDNAPYILQCPDGAHDLRTGTMLSRWDQFNTLDTRRTKVVPKAGPTPLFNDLLFHLSDDIPEAREWLLHYLGYTLLGDPSAQVFLILWGDGGNGKGVLMDVLKEILGDYANALNPTVILEKGRDMHPTSLMELKGLRIATVTEPDHAQAWNTELLKSITGNDLLEGRRMNKNPQKFRCTAGLIISCNNIPSFKKVGTAILRRLRMIGTTWTPRTPDPFLRQTILQQEGPAILAKLISYAKKIHEAGMILPEPPLCMQATVDTYLNDTDGFSAWMKRRCLTGPDYRQAETDVDAAKADLDAFMVERQKVLGGEESDADIVDVMSAKMFVKNLRRYGIKVTDEDNKRLRRTYGDRVLFMRGLRLKERE